MYILVAYDVIVIQLYIYLLLLLYIHWHNVVIHSELPPSNNRLYIEIDKGAKWDNCLSEKTVVGILGA